MVPIVIENTGAGERSYDIYSRLLKERIIFLQGEIDEEQANSIIAQLLFLEHDGAAPIHMYINSPGGSVNQTLAIYDVMEMVKEKTKLNTVCVGRAASGAAVLLSSGSSRLALPNSKIMIHQPWGSIEGQVTDMEISLKQMLKAKETICRIISKNTLKPVEQILRDCERDFWMDPQEAKEYGIIDDIFGG
jgi:ATP-dependent Clp protease protease subunit